MTHRPYGRTASRAIAFAAIIFFTLITVRAAQAEAPQFPPCCLQLTSVSFSELDLTWTPIGTPDPATTEYIVEREQGTSGGFITLATVGPNTNGYNDTNLAPNATYTYRVTTVNADGNSGPSSVQSGTTLGLPNSAPPAQPQLTAAAVSGSEIDLSWPAPASPSGITGYQIEREIGDFGNSFGTLVSSTTATSYHDTNLAPGGTYTYRVTAFNPYYPSSPSAAISAVTFTLPSPPQNIHAVASSTQATVSWQAPYNAATNGGVTTYIVTVSGGGFTSASSTTVGGTVMSTVMTGLTNGTSYAFTVSAVNGVGTGAPALSNTVVPLAAPSAPTPPPAALLPPTITPTPTATPAPVTPAIPVPTAPVYMFSGVLTFGMRSAAVTQLQTRLIKEGVYNGPVTGYFGALTVAGVKAYQKANGIITTGTVGPLTRARLNAGY